MTDEAFDVDALIALMERVTETRDFSLLTPEVRALVEQKLAEASETELVEPTAASATSYGVLPLGPNVVELMRSIIKAAGIRPAEWKRWVNEAQALDRSSETKLPDLAPVRLLGVNGHGLNPSPWPRWRHLRLVESGGSSV